MYHIPEGIADGEGEITNAGAEMIGKGDQLHTAFGDRRNGDTV